MSKSKLKTKGKRLPSWQRKAMANKPEGFTAICKHQEHDIAFALREAKMFGRLLKITQEEVRACNLVGFAASDATPAERAEGTRKYITELFEIGGVEVTCKECGAVAMGPLVPDKCYLPSWDPDDECAQRAKEDETFMRDLEPWTA